MSAGSKKRPSSAKRHIKYDTFSQFVSATRLRRVQDLLDGGNNGNKPEGIDAIICIAGIDSRYNEGCYELINYLLFGFFDTRKTELEKSGFPEEVIDDLMIVIRKNRVDLYCNPINWHYFLPYTSHWVNITYHCLQEEEFEADNDEGAEFTEEFKVHSLITMTHGCQRIGVPYYGLTSNEQKFDKMMVERWPVIQAFAVDDLGGGGFFTMKYEVVDVSKSVHQIYNFQDPVSIEMVVTESLPMLERQWDNMCNVVSMRLHSGSSVISQAGIAEGLCSFYQHGRVASHRTESGSTKEPFVLFGNNSGRDVLVALQSGAKGVDSHLNFSSIKSAAHMICQMTSPRSPLTCTRTYFFSPLYTGTDDSPEETVDRAELRYLVTIYSAMVNGVITGIQVYSQSASVSQARQKAVDSLIEGCHGIMNSTVSAYLSDRSKVVFAIETLHREGSVSEVVDGQRSACTKVASLTLYDLPAWHLMGPSPGSLVFSESFLDSALMVTGSGVSSIVDCDILYLTSHVSRQRLWGVSSDIVNDHNSIKSKIESEVAGKMGAVLMSGDPVDVTSTAFITLPPETVKLYAYKHGLVLYSECYGAFSLHASDCRKVQLFDGDSTATAVLLIITYHSESAAKLPPHLVGPDKTLVLVFPPRSKAHTHLYGQVLIGWRGDSEMPQVNRLQREELPDRLDELHGYLQMVHNNAGWLVSHAGAVTLKDAAHSLPQLPKFLTHLTANLALGIPVQQSDLPHLLQRDPDLNVSSDSEQVVVTILTGMPGSEKETLCAHLSTIGKDHIRWIVVSQLGEATLDIAQLHRMLTSAVTSHFQQETNRCQTRVLLLAPGFVNTPEVVSAIIRHPEPKVRNALKIGAITACIDPLNTFMQNRMTLPMLLNHCAQGWVNNIVFTSQTKAPSVLLDTVQSIIRSINSDVALMLADTGEVKRSTDLDLVLSDKAFEQPAMIRARYLLHPGWKLPKWPCVPCTLDMTDVLLKFSRPLEKAKLLQRLKALPSALSKFPFAGNIYHIAGHILFSDAGGTVDLRYTTLSQNLVLRSRGKQSAPVIRGQHQYYMVFTGCALREATLKDWLRTCAKQKPEKKRHLTRSDLTEKEIANVHRDRHLERLPPGWFYNGTQFVSMSGEKSSQHPLMEEFLAEYLNQRNDVVDRYNAAIDKDKYPDLFS